ncbi:site-specific recombinase [Acinetobacter pollinis]|uniref:site-specific recombinase n=1 Tax=Acinetobacter pollinis TaxID=2605270 RepID=UPI0018A266CB|nr:site-specific recombinase [Acinetobacter pollinis]MBF7691302.1 site-specific recombinase [Acinetobacter pollinis]MBF7693613.1 site-specific recombinase [Acinetobacter pollinis]MBF7698989.1 site-specific recombinase [Acinetobacter pollinis]MBF7699565.1 site-specific recombinase [Acinetobacter pollinis]
MNKKSFNVVYNEIKQQLGQTQAVLNEQPLVHLIAIIRPKNPKNTQEVKKNIQIFIQTLEETPHFKYVLSQYILKLITQYKQSNLYADSGILALDGFWNQLNQRMMYHLLPPIIDHAQIKELIGKVFYLSSDKYWLESIEVSDWKLIFEQLTIEQDLLVEKSQIKENILKAINILSYRISGIGLFPELLYAEPKLNEHESPFLAQNREITDFIAKYKNSIESAQQVGVYIPPDAAQAFVMIEQCLGVVNGIRRSTKRIGVSLTLTYLLTVLEQSLERLEILLQIVSDHTQTQGKAVHDLLYDLVKANHSEKRVGALLSANSELLALQVTENASKTGEHYVSTDKNGFFAMYKAAAGAGTIIATMSVIKILLARLSLAPILHALTYSMNYSLGFVLIHVLHFTVATKQPAMTAAALAATVQQRKGSRTTQLAELTELIVNIIRTQFIAILGNISIAIPVAAIITLSWPALFGEKLLNNIKATNLLHTLDPFTSLAVPHAAIAGVCLFLSGLIAGYFDNMAIYRKIGPRLKMHRGLRKLLGEKRQNKFADYIERNLGAISGNFLFGIMLGSMGTLGFILGLPLDIRHIAFASANLIQGLLSVSGSPDLGLILISCLGVALIGLTNLFVSFSLTIIVALRARRVKFEQWKPLAKLVLTHFFTRPSDFFWPPKEKVSITNDVKQTQKKDN